MWTFNAAFSAPLTGITESLQRYLFHWTKCWRNLVVINTWNSTGTGPVAHCVYAKHYDMFNYFPLSACDLCPFSMHGHVHIWSASNTHSWQCVPHVCVCVWKISHTSPLNFPHLTWKLSPRSVTFPSWKTGSDRLPCVSHIFICFCHVSPWPPTLTCQQCRFVSEWNTSSEEGSWPKIKSVSLRWCCLNRWVSSAFWEVFARDSKICVLLCLHDLFHSCPLRFIYLAMRVGNMKQKNLFWS